MHQITFLIKSRSVFFFYANFQLFHLMTVLVGAQHLRAFCCEIIFESRIALGNNLNSYKDITPVLLTILIATKTIHQSCLQY